MTQTIATHGDHPHWLYLSLSTILHLNFCVVMAANASHIGAHSGGVSTTPNSLLRLLCSSNVCRNGECYIIGSTPKCICEELFRGDRCQYVNLDAVNTVTIGCTVIFQWSRPPRLRGYSFVYFRIDSSDRIIFKNKIIMKDNEMSTLVGKLDRQNTEYKVCLEDEYTAELVVNTNAVDFLSNCVIVRTEPDYHTMAGYLFTGLLCCVVVVLIYYQRDKLELLFFSKPLFIYAKPKEPEDSEERSTSTP